MPPSLTVGIVNYNALAHLPLCLDSVHNLRNVRTRILIADNGSRDGSRQWLENHCSPSDLVLNETNLGFARAQNQLIRRMEGRFYLALNPDVILEPDYAALIVAALDTHPRFGWGLGRLRFASQPPRSNEVLYSVGHALLRGAFAFNLNREIGGGSTNVGHREVFGANAAAAIYKAELVQEMEGLFREFYDETMFMYYEDVDLDWRARLLGWKCLYVPDAHAAHAGDYTGASEDRWLTFQGIGNRYRSALKNSFWQDLVLCILPFMCLHLVFRLLLSPMMAARLMKELIRDLPLLWRKRRILWMSRRLARQEMLDWFEWARHQPGRESAALSRRLVRLLVS